MGDLRPVPRIDRLRSIQGVETVQPWRRATVSAAFHAARNDLGQVGAASLVGRAMRRLGAVWMDRQVDRLLGTPIYQAHLSAVGQSDPLFFLAHRHYLARGWSRHDRAAAATCHYLAGSGLLEPWALDAVYFGDGLELWSAQHGAHRYVIRLTFGLDVAQEGGASLSLWADNVRVCVLSFSLVPHRLVDDGPDTGAIAALITRKQLTRDRGYQRDFFDAFDRSAPAHLVLAALEGLAQSLGGERLYGLRAHAHPVYTPELAPHLTEAYCTFWQSLGGTPVSDYAYALEIPMQLRPVEDMAADRRARALARRAHADAIREAARQTMSGCIHDRSPKA